MSSNPLKVSLCAYPPLTCVELGSSQLEIVSLTKGRRVNSSKTLKVVQLYSLPTPNSLRATSPQDITRFLVWKDGKGKPKLTFQLVNCLVPSVLAAARVLLHCQQGQLLGNYVLCRSGTGRRLTRALRRQQSCLTSMY